MKLAEVTWPQVGAFSRSAVVVMPTGSLEQHGTHLPLFTDSLIVTAVAEAVEAMIPDSIILTPTIWLGASAHHLGFAGSLTNDFSSYEGGIISIVQSLVPHGFTKFYVLNGHGGNQDPNGIAIRTLKQNHPHLTFGHAGYFSFCEETIAEVLTGPISGMHHACEAETSLMLHLHPHLVHMDRATDDGLISEPELKGIVHTFSEMTENGVLGAPTFASVEKGKIIFDAAVAGVITELSTISSGYVLLGRE